MNHLELNHRGTGKVKISGIDMGGLGEILAQNENAIAIKWPAGTHWVGNHMPREYHSPEIAIYAIIGSSKEGWLQVETSRIIDWEVTRKKQG